MWFLIILYLIIIICMLVAFHQKNLFRRKQSWIDDTLLALRVWEETEQTQPMIDDASFLHKNGNVESFSIHKQYLTVYFRFPDETGYDILQELGSRYCLVNYRSLGTQKWTVYGLQMDASFVCDYVQGPKKNVKKHQGPFDAESIPKNLLQVTKNYQSSRIIHRLKEFTHDFHYLNFTDKECIEYMINHPIPDMTPQLLYKFNGFKTGAHKSDLFRYYWLYQNGGIYMDADLMIYRPIIQLLSEHPDKFISVKSIYKKTIFQGFIATPARHPIILRALIDIMRTSIKKYNHDYLLMTRQLYNIITTYPYSDQEVYLLHEKNHLFKGYTDILDDAQTIWFKHFYLKKSIPE